MENEPIKTVAGNWYSLTCTAAAAVTAEIDGESVTLATLDEGGTAIFCSPSATVTVDTAGKYRVLPTKAPASLGGGGGNDKQLRAEFEAHAADENIHLSTERSRGLNYMLDTYGPEVAPALVPAQQAEEGNWEYLPDSYLTWHFFSERQRLKADGTLPVYACLFPWYEQNDDGSNPWSATECEPEYLPDWCNGTPWLFDCLMPDGTPKQWRPSTSTEVGVDDYQGEHLWSWWNCNYVRCDNGNRRITAVEGMSTYQEEGEVDVGVMYATRWCHFGMVELPWQGTTRKYTLVVISGGPMTDTRFPAAYKARLQEMGVTELKLFKECQRYSGPSHEISPAPYGLHSKYFCVLGGSGNTGRKPRSQRGHIINEVGHNVLVKGEPITDGVNYGDANVRHSGVTDFQSKGAGYWGSGMDRNLFIILHLMIKSGSKNLQMYMTGQVNALHGSVACQLGSTAAAQVFGPDSASPLVAPGSSVLVIKGAESGFQVNDFVAIGGSYQQEYTRNNQAHGRIIGFYDHIHPDTQEEYTEIALELQFGKARFTYTASHYIAQHPTPSGTTDLVPGHDDGSAYNLTGSHASPCRVMGTEYGVGGFQIFMDVVQEYTTGNLLRLWYASPQTPRQTEEERIRSSYADLGTYGKSGSYYAADAVVDVERGTYMQTAPASFSTGSSTTGFCDRVVKAGGVSGMNTYLAYGATNWMNGADAGLFSVQVTNSALTGRVWFFTVCD